MEKVLENALETSLKVVVLINHL